MMTMHERNIEIVGVYQKVEAYPNVLFLIKELKLSGKYNYKEYNYPMWSGSLSKKNSLLKNTKNLFRVIFSHFTVILYFLKSPKKEFIYIPYPAIFVSLSLLLLPKSKKPKNVVIDAFISIYDTTVIDRNLFSKKSIFSKLLRKIEKLAFKQAQVVITDTPQNSQYYAQIFDLPINKFKSVPLATDEENFKKIDYSHFNPRGVFNIIFIGTLIPLHGIEIILKAAAKLSGNKHIQFTIIGNGQMAGLIEEAFRSGLKNIKWIQQWQTSKELAIHLSQANLALGIFGTGDKTQRVCPLKLYAYMACGLPIITGETKWSNQIIKKRGHLPFLTAPLGSPEKLVDSIISCYESKELCISLSLDGYHYYTNELSNKKAVQDFEDILGAHE